MAKRKKLDISPEEIDREVRGAVLALNDLPFLATTESCSGHSYNVDFYKGGRHTSGYIHLRRYGEGTKREHKEFKRRVKEFTDGYNSRHSTKFQLIDWDSMSPDVSEICFYPTDVKDMWGSHMTNELFFDSNNRRDKQRIPERRIKAWKKLEEFVKEYKAQ